jgi:TPR repeat protein
MSNERPMSLGFAIALVLSIICLAVPAWADFQAGKDDYDRGDFATALEWYEKAAAQGDVQSQSHLGWLYFYGLGVPQDYAQAREWYEKAAAQGDTSAATNVGIMYQEGYGVPQDYLTALFWLRRAADHGIAMAQGKLGVMYQEGWGPTQDYVEAHKWYNLAATYGDKPAADLRDALANQMTPAQIAEAQKLAREWKPKTPSVPR